MAIYTYSIVYIYSAKNLLYRCEPIHSRFPRVFLHTLCIDRDACSTIKRPKRVCQVLLCVVQFRFLNFFCYFGGLKNDFPPSESDRGGFATSDRTTNTIPIYDMTQYHVYKIVYGYIYIQVGTYYSRCTKTMTKTIIYYNIIYNIIMAK